MKIITGSYSIARYCEELQAGKIIVNRTYQRGDKIWPTSAVSYLLDSILLGFPLPKFLLWQRTDLKTKNTTLEIVDGQQRSNAIRHFYEDKFIISTGTFRGNRYSTLEPSIQSEFLAYQVATDTFADTTEDQVREVFRRMNSYTAPLNRQEQRHARYQGEFKVFIASTVGEFSSVLLHLGVFNERQLIRMNDAELITDLVRAMQHGIETASAAKLDQIYAEYDQAFPHANQVGDALASAFELLLQLPELRQSPLMTRYGIYSLLLAIVNQRANFPALRRYFVTRTPQSLRVEDIAVNLGRLAEALELRNERGSFAEFVKASEAATNTLKNRQIRFEWFSRALTDRVFPS